MTNNNVETLSSKHLFDYYDPMEMPERLSYSIDYLGYYNGKDNVTLLPDMRKFGVDDEAFANLNFADRTPDFEFAKKGALKSIMYPTGGKVVFDYEAIPVKIPKYSNTYLNIGYNLMGGPDDLDNSDSFFNLPSNTLVGEKLKEFTFSSLVGSTLHIKIKLNSQNTAQLPNKMKALFEVVEKNTNQIIFAKELFISKILPDASFETDLSIDKTVPYVLRFKVLDNYCSECTGTVKLTHQSGWDIIEGANIRLKKQYEINETDSVGIKRLYYSSFKDLGNLEKIPTDKFIPDFFSSTFRQSPIPVSYDPCFESGGPFGNYATSILEEIINSAPVTQRFLDIVYENFFDPRYNTVTTSYGGDNFEKGGEEKQFYSNILNQFAELRTPVFTGSLDPSMVVTPEQEINLISLVETARKSFERNDIHANSEGTMTQRKVFRVNNSIPLILHKEIHQYAMSDIPIHYNVIGTKIYNELSNTDSNNLFIGYYPILISSSSLNQSTFTSYLEDVPLDILDDSNYKKNVTVKVNGYNSTNHHQLTKQTISFSDTSIQETNYQYAHEKNNPYLIGKNMVEIPLETSVRKRKDPSDLLGKPISKTEIIYPVSQSEADTKTSGLALPYEMRSTDPLGVNSLEATYDQYDVKGNLLQYTTKDGIPTTIIWGYNGTQPIAKLIGAAYSLVSSLAADIVTASDTDATAAVNNDETSFLLALDLFRRDSRLADFQITTYSYDPLIGVRSITPPSGIREVYVYDNANRLKEIREDNAGGKILKEFKYNYKH